jgi:hypothetical protein
MGNCSSNHALGGLPGSSGGGGATVVGGRATQFCGSGGSQGHFSTITGSSNCGATEEVTGVVEEHLVETELVAVAVELWWLVTTRQITACV